MRQSKSDIRSAYDKAAESYANQFINELDHKPGDMELLRRFATKVGAGQQVLDIGCGPGHTTNCLHTLGIEPLGIDLSPAMVAKAQELFPHIRFIQGDFLDFPGGVESVAGILAFYCIVHLPTENLANAFKEMYRVLRPDGTLLLSFHVGSEAVQVDDFLDSGATLEFYPHEIAEVEKALEAAEFELTSTVDRDPYDQEYPTRRCYIFARKPA